MTKGQKTSDQSLFVRVQACKTRKSSPLKSLYFICAFILLSVFSLALPQAALANPNYASIVIDAETGLVLHQRYADKSLHPASLTKIMTLMMAFEALDQGKIGLKDRIRISNRAAGMVPSKLGLPAGSSIRVQDAIYALVTKSANDIAVAMAEHLAGTESNFAQHMTNRAREIGMGRTTFRNASGLHDPRQVTTARDMAMLARFVIRAYPEYYTYFSRKSFTYEGKTYRNHNRLMETYPGMDGMKTGYIAASGFNLVASAVHDRRRLIGVVFGGRSSQTRNAHMKELLDNGFAKTKDMRIARAEVPIPARKPAIAQAVAMLNSAQQTGNPVYVADAETQTYESGFEKLIGEGDFDPAASRRIETGLMAISAHTGEQKLAMNNFAEARTARLIPVSQRPATIDPSAPWSVQIGAFSSRAATDRAIQNTLQRLPAPFNTAQPLIAPLKTAEGWLFRARLTGFSKDQALSACNYIRDCLPVAPQN